MPGLFKTSDRPPEGVRVHSSDGKIDEYGYWSQFGEFKGKIEWPEEASDCIGKIVEGSEDLTDQESIVSYAKKLEKASLAWKKELFLQVLKNC